MSDNVSGADNQQETLMNIRGSSETIRRAPLLNKEITAYLQGALHDATLNKKRRFRFSQKNKEWLSVLKNLLARLGFNSWIYREGKERNLYVLETLAKVLDFDLDPLCLNTGIERRAYIRGFFDAEGGLPHNSEKRFYIQLVQNDKIKLMKMKKILLSLGINTGNIHNPSRRVDPNYWRMYILVDSHLQFVKIISSWHPQKIKILQERMMI